MHPTVIRDNNKEKCPICFMPLSKRARGEATDETLPAGTVARVQLSPYRVVLAGVRTAPVGFVPVHREIITVGTVEFDERALRTVSVRFKARIDKLFVNQTGQAVAKGDPLASVYSPDLVVTVQNRLDARKANNTDGEANARSRLALWGVEADQIDEIVKAGKPITHLTVRSPITGHVIKKYPREGQYVDEGGPLFDVADLSIGCSPLRGVTWRSCRRAHDRNPVAGAAPAGRGDDPRRPGRRSRVARSCSARGPDSRTLTARFGRQRTTNAAGDDGHGPPPGRGDETPTERKRLRVENGRCWRCPSPR